MSCATIRSSPREAYLKRCTSIYVSVVDVGLHVWHRQERLRLPWISTSGGLILLSFYSVGVYPLLAFPFCECLTVLSRPPMSTMLTHVLFIPSRLLPLTIGNILKLVPRCDSSLFWISRIRKSFSHLMVLISCCTCPLCLDIASCRLAPDCKCS